MTDTASTAPEFSRPVDLSRIGSGEVAFDIGADAAERAALVRRFDLLGLARLEARVTLRRTPRGAMGGSMLRLAGHLSADITQACVITLEPVESRIEHDFAVLYGDEEESAAAGKGGEGREITIDAAREEAVEPLPDGSLDIGEAVAQEFGLALNPYPHAAGAALESLPAPEAGAPAAVNPFAALAKLRKPPGEGKA